MSARHNKRMDSKNQRSLSVTSKCLAIVLVLEENDNSKGKVEISGKDILEDFKLRNKTCYWNPALVDSIANLQYVGFVEPSTILVGASDIHLENLRTAWGRRVLNDPADYKIQRIGDVNGIEMQVIPQTQFIPLPEILCLIILELNNKQIIATLDVIHERLAQCFQDMQRPNGQLLYETLGNLIRERKIFHTGSGYFVVTPDTYRLPTDQPQLSYPLSWLHYNQMYIPVLNQQRTHVRDISCQVSLVSQPQKKPPQHQQITNLISKYGQEEEEPIYKGADTELEPQQAVANERGRISRSLSTRRVKDKKEDTDTKPVQRSSSVRSRGEKSKSASPACRDVNLAKSNINKVKDKGEKKSLLSKIFGRSKKKKQQQQKSPETSSDPSNTVSNDVEYGTFSAQFPPPEWKWYQEQMDKQHRLNEWIIQQKPGEVLPHQGQVSSRPGHKYPMCPLPQGRHLCHKPPLSSAQSEESHYCQIDSRFELGMRNVKASTLPVSHAQSVSQFTDSVRGQAVHQGNEKRAVTLPANIAEENHHVHRRHSESHRRRRDAGDRPRIRRHSGDRKQVEQPIPTLHEDIVYQNTSPALPYHVQTKDTKHVHMTEPMYSSTPRVTCQDYETIETIHNNTIDEMHNADKHRNLERQVVHRRSEHGHRKSKNRHHRHTYVGHPGNDISYEYHGKVAKKNLQRALSRDSGVNCIGLESNGNNPMEILPRGKSYRKSSKSKEESGISRNDKQNNLRKDCKNDLMLRDNDVKLEYRKNEVVCVAEINNCVPEGAGEVTGVVLDFDMEMIDKESSKSSNGNSVVEESEQSYDTVIDSKSRNKVTDICEKTRNLNLGDSGFSSPRISENVEIKNQNLNEENESHNEMFVKNVDEKYENDSHFSSGSGKDNKNISHPLKGCQKDNISHQNGKFLTTKSDLTVLNNINDVHSKVVPHHHINVMQTDLKYPPLPLEADGKMNTVQQIPFHFHGDYHVVGVV